MSAIEFQVLKPSGSKDHKPEHLQIVANTVLVRSLIRLTYFLGLPSEPDAVHI